MGKLVLPILFVLFGFESVSGQTSRIWVGPSDEGSNNPRWATLEDFDGSSLVFCRGYYETNRFESGVLGWYVDYPGADNNFLVRLSELTKTRIRFDAKGNPIYVVVRLDSPLIFYCPVVFLSDVGTIGLKDSEITNLRQYLEKGGFIWADDFWGSEGWNHWEYQIRLVLPENLYRMVDISTVHPIMNTAYYIPEIPQIPNIGFWYKKKGETSERGDDSHEVHFRGIEDKKYRLMVVMTHNTDIGETWEREAKVFDPTGEFFNTFSPIGYKIGISIFMYALTH